MAGSRLIVVEGIPGSGKTSIATTIKRLLDEAQIPNELFLEGDLNHPADYESVAWFPRKEYVEFLQRHTDYRRLLEQYTEMKDEDCFLGYRKLENAHRQEIPSSLISELAQRDVYEVPTPDLYCRLALERWKAFSNAAQSVEKTYIFECCLLQNPLAVLMIRHNIAESYALNHIQSVIDVVQPLDPVIIYLWQQDTWATFERITSERPKEWIDYVIGYLERGQWGKANHLQGYESVVAYHDLRKKIEIKFLRELGSRALLVENSDADWQRCRQEVDGYVRSVMGI